MDKVHSSPWYTHLRHARNLIKAAVPRTQGRAITFQRARTWEWWNGDKKLCLCIFQAKSFRSKASTLDQREYVISIHIYTTTLCVYVVYYPMLALSYMFSAVGWCHIDAPTATLLSFQEHLAAWQTKTFNFPSKYYLLCMKLAFSIHFFAFVCLFVRLCYFCLCVIFFIDKYSMSTCEKVLLGILAKNACTHCVLISDMRLMD